MESSEIRKKFLRFFEEKGHLIMPSSSLVPDNDPTVLLTTAGMQQFKQYFAGEEEPPAKRLASCQKCFRTTDIDSVGDEKHLTFFEMLGNFSIGDYFKKEAIEWAWEFVTEVLKIDKQKLWATVFAGENDIPEDEEAEKIWLSVGMPKERIIKLGRSENFWGPAGTSGPCGPCSEIHVDMGPVHEGECTPAHDCGRFLEIWNLVFTQFNQKEDGSLELLPAKNIDTGAGLERLARVLQNRRSIYETDLFAPIIVKIEEISGKKYGLDKNFDRRIRIIADHIRGITFLIADGVVPSNKEQGYILRRVIRRAVAQGRLLGIEKPFLAELAIKVLDILGEAYPEAAKQQKKILEVATEEESRFNKTLNSAMKELEKAIEVSQAAKSSIIAGERAFFIHDSLGMPIELIEELASARGFSVDRKKFDKLMEEQKERARKATEKLQREVSEELIARNHTATHLLHAALHRVLGKHALQAGSYLIGREFRFDFVHPKAMTKDEIEKVEKLVNDWIKKDLPVIMETKSYKEAIAEGAMALFHEKYADQVKVYTIKDKDEIVSKELCAGPHVNRTGEIKSFKILKEQSSSAGVRRLRACVD